MLAILAASAVGPIRFAAAQQLANGFDQAMQSAAQPSQSATAASTAILNPTPHVPEAVSRPAGWPGAGSDGEKHVLSSIRKKPGSPLIPVEAFGVKQAGGPDEGKDGVRAANFESPAGAPTATDAVAAPAGEPRSLETALVVARVGPQVVLESDLMTPSMSEWFAKVTPGLTAEQIRELKNQVFKQMVRQYVESLIVYVDACRTIPEEKLPEIEKKVNEAFDQQQLPRLMKDAGVSSVGEYEQLLRSRGQSLDRIRKTFFERALAQQWMEQKVASDHEIPHADLIAYYQQNLSDYEFPAKAKFEQLMVRISPSRPRDEAWKRIAEMGNAVLTGRPFADVAREMSEGPTARQGGEYDWTNKGSLASKVVDTAIFSLPVGQMSTILEEESALHIVRVTERTDAGRVSFIEAQADIREQLRKDRKKKEIEAYLVRLRERTPVWTIYDEQPSGPVVAGRPQQPAR